ncbi:MAG: S-layer homology domain-containing protein, partial [Gorillibacterium sp.]|nr:S-layer homology domain-containing protein [Gorillibacterium sp.]
MKKVLSLALTFALASSAFAGIAGAAELTTNDKFDALVTQGIFAGVDAAGTPGLEMNMNRAQLAVILAKLNDKVQAPAASTYTDVVASHWGKGWIGAVTEAKLMEGLGGNKFGPANTVSYEMLATVIAKSKGLTAATTTTVTGVSNWAKGWVQTALDAKLITPQTDYTKLAPRGALVDSAYVVYEAKIVAAIKSAKQIGAKSIEVTFVNPVAATQTVTVKSGFLPVDGKLVFNETRTVATFTTV